MLHIESCGDDTFSVVIKKRSKRRAMARQLRDSGDWIECVEGRQSLVVQFDATSTSCEVAQKRLRRALKALVSSPAVESSLIEIPVCYGGDYGPELRSICEMLELDEAEAIRLHTSGDHLVDMLGFTPGFAYVDGLSRELNVPRLGEPRQRVAAGSVGIAGGQTGLYALSGPGGWPLIGRTPVRLFRPDEADVFLLEAGVRIRFTAIDDATFQRLRRE